MRAATQTYQDANALDTWNLADFNWDAGAATWTDGNDAVFAGTGEAVTVGTVAVHNMVFDSAGYNLSGGTITLTGASPTLTANQGAIIGSIVAGGNLTKNGAGVLTLSGPNTYTGGTELLAGTISVGAMSGIGTGYLAVKFGSTFQYTGSGGETSTSILYLDNGASTFDISNPSGSLTWNPGGGTRNAAFTKTGAGTLTMGGAFSGGAAVTVNGGTLALSAANSHTGASTITSGTLVASNISALGAGNVALNGGTLHLATDTAHASRDVTVGGDSSIILDRATAGAGFTTAFGALTFNDTHTLSVSKGANVTSGTATLNFTGFPALGAAGKTAGFNVGSGVEVHLSGSLTGTQAFARVEKSGAGTLILSGNNNWWDPAGNTGLVTVSGGTLDLRSQNAMGDGTTGGNSIALSMAAGTTLRIGTDTALGNYANTTITGDGVTISADRATAGAGLTNQFNTLAVNGAYTLNVLGGANVTSGTTQVNFNATTLGGNATFNIVNPAAGSAVMNIAGVVGESGGARSLTKAGSGRLNLTNANTYTGGTTVNAGILSLGTGGATGAIRGTLTVNPGASVVYTAANPFGYTAGVSVNVLNINGGTVGNAGFGNHFWNNFQLNMTGGTLNLGYGAAQTFNEFHSPTITVNSSADTATIAAADANAVMRLRDGTSGTFNVADGAQAVDLLVTAPITYGSLTSGITKTGAGVMQLTGASSYNGNTTVSGGTLKISGTGRIYSAAHSTAVVTVQTGGVLELDTWLYGGATQSLGMLAAGAGQIVLNDGTIRMNGTTSYGRGVTVNAGGATLEAASGANWTIDTVLDNTNWIYNGNPSLTFTGAGTGTFQKVFSGTGAVTKSGAGTWTLSGVNTYSGATTISAGTLEIGGAGQLGGGTYAGAITNNGVLQVNSSASQTLSGTMTGSGSVIKAGGGTLTFSTQKTYTGGTTVNGGILDLTGGGGASGTIRGTVTVNSGASLRLSANDVTGYGTDATRLAIINLVGGNMHVATTGGTGQNQTLGNATINMTGATITGVAGSNMDFFQGSSALNSLASATPSTISGTRLNIRQASVTFTVADGAAATDLDISSQIYGGALVKSGTGVLRLTGPNIYTGDTTIQAGTLELGGSGQLGAGTYAGAIGNTGTLLVNTTANQTLSGNMTGGGALVKDNTGILTLSTPKSYTGATTVNGGTLTVNGTGTLGGTTGLSVASGATFNYTPSTLGTMTMGAGSTLALAGDSTLGLNWDAATSSRIAALGAATIGSGVKVSMTGTYTSGTPYTILTAGSGLDSGSYTAINNVDYTAAFTQSPTSVILTPTSTTALTAAYWLGGTSGYESVLGVASNWTTDGAGTVSGLAPGAGANVIFSDAGAAAGNQVNMTLGANMALNSITVNGSTGTPANTNPVSLAAADGYTLTLGSTTGSGIFVNPGAGAVTLAPAIALGNAQTWSNDSANALTVNGVVSGGNALTKAGTGEVVLSGANTYSGGTVVNAGTLTAYAGASAGAKAMFGTGAVTVNAGAAVRLFADSTANAMSYANNFTLNDATLVSEDAGVTVNGTLTLTGANTVNVVYSNKSISFSGVVSGAGSVHKTGPGWLWFDNTGNTYAGGTTVSAGTFAVNAGTAAGAKSSFGTGDVTVNSGGTVRVYAGSTGNAMSYANNFNLNGGALRSEDAVVTYGGTITLTGANTVDVVHAGKNAIFANPVGGAGSLSKTGNGTLILAADNTYAGSTTILGGPLQVGNGGTTGSLGADAGTLTNNGTLIFNRSDAVALNNAVTGTGGVANYGAGTLTLNGIQTYTGDTTVRQGAVNLPSGTLNGTARIMVGASGGTGTPVFTLNGGTIVAGVAGTGNAIYLGATSSFPGQMNVTSGSFSTTSTSALFTVGDNAVGTYIQAGGTVSAGSVSGGVWVANNPGGTGSVFSVSGGTFNAPGTSVLGVRGSYAFTVSGTGAVNLGTIQFGHTGGTTNNPTGRVINLDGGTLQLTNGFNHQNGAAVVNLNGGTLQAASSTATFWNNNANVTATLGAGGGFIDSNGFNITINQVLGGAGSLTKTGAGTLTLSGSNPYTGGTVVNAGNLHLAGALTGGGAVTVNGSSALTQDAAGVIGGASTYTHDSSGTSILAASNTYTGTTTVSQGTLLIPGSTPAAGLINVSAGATLGGSGFGGVTTLADEAILSPGTADGSEAKYFTLASLAMSGQSVYRFEPGNPSATYYTDPNDSFYTDHVTITGALTLDGRLLVANRPDLSSFDMSTAVAGDRWLVASYSGGLTNNTLEIDPASAPLAPGLVYKINTTDNLGHIYLEVAVPEAGTGALLMLGLALLLRRRIG